VDSKYLKYLALFFTVVVLGIGVLLWRPFSSSYYSSIAVTFGRYDYPFITTELQNQSSELAVDVGSRFPLALRRDTLDGILNKHPCGTITVHNIDGLKREAPSYLIPKLKVGDLTLKNVIAHESLEESYDALGQFLGGEFNLLVDFPHSRITACDTFSKLHKKKLAGKHWVRVPFEMHCSGIVLNVDTDSGTRRLAINTTCTFTHLRSSLISSGQSSISSSFCLGRQQFGNVVFRSIDLPEGLSEIDGFIGMDFLKKHAIYLDYTHKIAYIEPPDRYFERIPITFASRGGPTVGVSIEGTVYPLELDLGGSFPFSLRQEILRNIFKTKYGTAEWCDFRGKKYESPTYTIPEIKISNLTFANMLTKQNREDFYANVTLSGLPSQPIGAIGLPIIEKYNLCLDFPHSTIYASNDYLLLQQAGVLSQNLLAIPFTLHPDGILLCVETDVGTYRLILDTGATRTMIRAPHPTATAQFLIMGHDFGERSILAIDLNPRFDFDGCLGLDFLREYPLFIDYSNKIVFLDLQENSSHFFKLEIEDKDRSSGYPSSKELPWERLL
jgi:hypothetical protein